MATVSFYAGDARSKFLFFTVRRDEIPKRGSGYDNSVSLSVQLVIVVLKERLPSVDPSLCYKGVRFH